MTFKGIEEAKNASIFEEFQKNWLIILVKVPGPLKVNVT